MEASECFNTTEEAMSKFTALVIAGFGELKEPNTKSQKSDISSHIWANICIYIYMISLILIHLNLLEHFLGKSHSPNPNHLLSSDLLWGRYIPKQKKLWRVSSFTSTVKQQENALKKVHTLMYEFFFRMICVLGVVSFWYRSCGLVSHMKHPEGWYLHLKQWWCPQVIRWVAFVHRIWYDIYL